MRGMPVGLRSSVAAMDTVFAHESARLARLQRIKWCRVTPSPAAVAIGPLTTDTRLLRKAADEAGRFMRGALKGVDPLRVV